MTDPDPRQANRDSLSLTAQLKVVGQDGAHRVKVRNLSAQGMMAEGEVKVTRGSLVAVELPGLGWIEGTVAWKQDNRFGIAFIDGIEPTAVHDPAGPQAT